MSAAVHASSSADSAVALLSLLDEPDADLISHALSSLIATVEVAWAEISDKLETMYVNYSHIHMSLNLRREVLYEAGETDQKTREMAAMLLSKVYFHLGASEESVTFVSTSIQ